MSGKNNVNPDYYKTAGRDKPGDDLPPVPAPEASAAPPRRRGRGRPARNFIPGAPPVGEPAPPRPESGGGEREKGRR